MSKLDANEHDIKKGRAKTRKFKAVICLGDTYLCEDVSTVVILTLKRIHFL